MKKKEGTPYASTRSRREYKKYLGKWNQWSMELKGRKCLCHKQVLAYGLEEAYWPFHSLITCSLPIVFSISKSYYPFEQLLYPTHLAFILLSLYSALMTLLHFCIRNSLHSSFSSVQFSHSVVSCFLWPHELQHARPPCPSATLGVHSNSLHWVGDAIQPFHPLSSPSPPAPNPSQHQSLFQWVNSSHEVAKVLEFQL